MHFDRRGSFRIALTSAIAVAAFVGCAQAQTYDYRVHHRFSFELRDGSVPVGAVQFDAAGNLYGTTTYGGAHNLGTIFKIARNGRETIVHSFEGGPEGSRPWGPVIVDPATGDLYGTTYIGGQVCFPYGCGVLYKQAASGEFTVLHDFDARNDGSLFGDHGLQYMRLLRDVQGNMYGTALSGGTIGCGTIFKYGADGSFTVLHRFDGSDGCGPNGGVIGDSAGNLYGVTTGFETGDKGTIYKLASDGTFTTLYSFTGGVDGFGPKGPLTYDGTGSLYGVTSNTVFRLTPDGILTTLYTFDGHDGSTPVGGLLLINGNLYGTTEVGGDYDCYREGCGVVFRLAPNGNQTLLHTFELSTGINPRAGLTYKYGRLFGTTYFGGGEAAGTVFSIGVGR